MRRIGSILLDVDVAVAEYVAARIPGISFDRCVGIGVVRDDRFVGGVVFHNFRGCDVEVVGAFDDPRWALPGTLRALFAYPFVTLGCVRLTAIVQRNNKRARRLCIGLGFKLEGVARKAIDGKQDAMIYGMLREECRFLRTPHNGQEEHARRAACA